MGRKLASVQKIKEVIKHSGADRLDIVKVLGWQCVSKKGEFKKGDFCVYFEIDSLIPSTPWSVFLENKNKPGKSARLRTIRLRGEISQGLALPLSILEKNKKDWNEGDDVTEMLGIEKYEVAVPVCLSGKFKGRRPGYITKTDEDRIQAFPDLIEEFQGVEVYITQKIDGTSGSFAFNNGEFDVCGRNWSYEEGKNNTYWKIAKKYDLFAKLKDVHEKTGKNYAIQAEKKAGFCVGEKRA